MVFLAAGGPGVETSLLWETVRVFIAVLLVLPLAYFFTRFYASRVQPRTGGVIRVIDRLPVGGNKSLLVVAVQDRVFLLGVADQKISRLGEWEDDGTLSTQSRALPSPGFASVLQQVLRKKDGKRK